MFFSDLDIVQYVLLGMLGVLFIAQIYWYTRYMCASSRKIRKSKRQTPSSEDDPSSSEGVSVVLCAHNEAYNISNYLQALLTQDYPEYEVIVVDDGSEDETRAMIERYMVHDERLHMTFVPYGARVGSTKKLALTLAAKAAKYDYLLLTDADCVPESNQWIRSMMAGFREKQGGKAQGTKDIILGFSPYFETKGFVNRLIRFDTLFNGLHYLGDALCGHPYMGVGRNLAYRKSLFFESGGFTHSMTSKAGDDDLFVNHVATPANTAVVVARDSYMWSLPKTTLRDWLQQKRRHLSVSPNYRLGTRIRLLMEPLTRGLFYAMVIGIIVWQLIENNFQFSIMDLHQLALDYQLSIIALGLFMVRWVMQTAILNTSARKMGLKRFSMASILWFDITLPLVNLWMLLVPKKQKKW